MSLWNSLEFLHKINSILIISWVVISAVFGLLSWKIQSKISKLNINSEKELTTKVEATKSNAKEFENKLLESERLRIETENRLKQEIEKRDPEHGTWDPSVQYITDDSRNGYAQEISVVVKDYQYQRNQEIAKISFDFSVDLKQVPSGSTLTIEGAPFTIVNGKLTEFTINQTGLNYSGEVMVSARPNTTRFVVMVNTESVQKAYVTDGSEGSVRFWGYIVYKCGYYPP